MKTSLMASLIPGYEYDIFISYRHKDNKYDGWVSEFVSNLRKELEATFKEDISIYFDENPHDGLLETHHVDKSLVGKLKCLICIPILSQTYCDPKSFAWSNEFLVFRNLAAGDPYGLDVKLSNGNVVSRILPVRIHDLDTRDLTLFQKETGAPLRAVDFIFKSAGVNRPLRANEDHPHDNLNKSYYRDQINKVANLVKEIFFAIYPGNDNELDGNAPATMLLRHSRAIDQDSVYSKSLQRTNGTFIFNRNDWKTRVAVPLLFSVLLLIVITAWAWLMPVSDELTTYSAIPIEKPDGFIDQNPYFAITSDGRTIAYVQAAKGINLQSLSGFGIKLLPDTEGAQHVTFSPDQHALVYYDDGRIYKIGVAGSPRSLISEVTVGVGMCWGSDDNIYFSGGLGAAGIWRVVSAGGGQPEQITVVADSLGEDAHSWPQLLPDNNTLLFTVLGASGGHVDSRVVIENLHSHERNILVEKAISGRYLSNGNLIYATNDGSVFMIPFDLESLSIKGQPVAVLSGVTTGTWGGAAYMAVSETGNMVFLPITEGPSYVLEVVERSGKVIPWDPMAESILSGTVGHGWGNLQISPSGEHMAVTGRSYGKSDIWVLDNATGDADRITFDIAEDEYPVWSPDAKAIAFTSAYTGALRRLFVKHLASDSGQHLIGTWPRHVHFSSWSPDGKWLAAHDFSTTGGRDCWVLSIDGKTTIPVANSPANEGEAKFSPDGRWLVFQSDESGRFEIYVMAFPSMMNKRQVSIEGGMHPRWDPNGNFIYYIQDGFMMAHSVEPGNEFKKGKAERLFPCGDPDFDVSRDGKKFYLRKRNPAKDREYLHLVTNWFGELKKKAPQDR